MSGEHIWPELSYAQSRATCETLHLWTQIVGKIRLALTPWNIHSWHSTLYLTARGLTTSPIPCGERTFEIYFDFIDHRLLIEVDDGARQALALREQSVADFHDALFEALRALGLTVRIHGVPNEVPDPIPFVEDQVHRSYDPDYVYRLWRAFLQVERIFKKFKTGFVGKVSPVHLFWGSFDLAVTRFSGRPAPLHPGGIPGLPDAITREAYSHEVSSAGFWPGGGPTDYPAFYSYAYPAPDGFGARPVKPSAAFYSEQAGEFLLPYEAVRAAQDPEATLLEFLQSTYESAADLAGWDRTGLECSIGVPGQPREV